MVNPVTAMKVLNERKKFMKKHPDFFAYFVGVFGSGVEEDFFQDPGGRFGPEDF